MKLDRRQVLVQATFLPMLADMARAQSNPISAPPQPRLLTLKAQAIQARLSGEDKPESTLFRLIEPPATGGATKPTTDKPPADQQSIPVFRAKQGEAFGLRIENTLAQPISLHPRGMRQANIADGVAGLTAPPIAPGATGTAMLSTQQPGTFILSPLVAEHAAEQNSRGLGAVFIVEEAAPPPVDLDMALAVSDWRADERGALSADFMALKDSARIGRLGNRLIANGLPAPGSTVVRPNARLRVRLVNVANARALPLKVTNLKAMVIAIDSTPCQPFDPLKRTVMLSPGSRIEMILDAPDKAGETGLIEAKVGDGVPIFSFRTEGDVLPAKPPLTALPDPGLPPAIRLQDATRVDVTIAGGTGRDAQSADPVILARLFPDPKAVFTINGARGSFSGKPITSLKRGKVLVLALNNKTAWPQVIAIHGHAFRLLHPYDDGWEPYFLDTLYLPANTISRLALIADNPGKWAIRSTIAEHLATGVMSWFEVTP